MDVGRRETRWVAMLLLLATGCAPSAGGLGETDTDASTGSSSEAASMVSTNATPPADSTGSGSGAGSGDGETTAAVPDVGLPACALDTPPPEAMAEHTLDHDGQERRFLVHVPTAYDHQTPLPVVLAFHGYTNTPQQQEQWSMMSAKAEEAGFILVYPYGSGIPSAWNGGDCCALGMPDDVGFVAAMIDWLQEQLCIDPARVYATGFSNGGFLSHRLGCELADRIAAVGPVAGMMGIDDCAPSRPMPVLHMHGTGDFVVPYEGSAILGFRSAEESFTGWAGRNGCAGEPVISYDQGDVTCRSYQECDGGAAVELCTVEGGGHTWPGGADIFGAGPTTHDIVANDYLWDFFMAHPLP
ncbi:MAG: hypothetical protein KDK70_37095 [Myxococcales bacterium]|nr:hypothetical protein [Myxococcales bacterium]